MRFCPLSFLSPCSSPGISCISVDLLSHLPGEIKDHLILHSPCLIYYQIPLLSPGRCHVSPSASCAAQRTTWVRMTCVSLPSFDFRVASVLCRSVEVNGLVQGHTAANGSQDWRSPSLLGAPFTLFQGLIDWVLFHLSRAPLLYIYKW